MTYAVRKCAVGLCKTVLYPPEHQKHWAIQCDRCTEKMLKRLESEK